MRLVRFVTPEGWAYGIAVDGHVRAISREPFEEISPGAPLPLEEVELLSPVVPSKVVAIGLNYSDHAEELGMEPPREPIMFIKAPSTLIGHGGEIVYPAQSGRVDYEAELAVVIGRETRSVGPENAPVHVLGYTCGLDMTARDLQKKDGQWTRAKNFDTFCPLGPWVETEVDPADLALELRLNGELRQSSRTSRMIFDVGFLVSFVSSVMTLLPGDVILTGTPPGVGQVAPGDSIEMSIEGIGTLNCGVVGPD